MNLPNGMARVYTYDTRDRLTKIQLKDATTGGNVVEEYDYTLDAAGLIDQIDELNGDSWVYDYDSRYRLTSATLSTSTNVDADWTYTYDDGDNLLTKVSPYMDDFQDGAYTGWYVGAGTWDASNYYLEDTGAGGTSYLWNLGMTDDDHEARFRIRRTNSTAFATYNIRYTNSNNRVRLEFSGTAAYITERVSGTTTTIATNSSAGLTEDVWYDVRVIADGTSIKVWLAEDGEMPEEIFDENVSSSSLTSSWVGFLNTDGSTVEYDDVWLVGASLSNTTTYAYNTANELTSMTGPNGTTTYSYDELGRMTNKSRSSFSADYSWHYNDMLTEVDTDFPGESDVTYEYGGDGKRRERTTGGVTTTYNFGASLFALSEEDASGNLIRAHTIDGIIEGTNPVSGTASYGSYDHVGSTRSLYDSNKGQVSAFKCAPYGEIAYAHDGTNASRLYGGLVWDASIALYMAPLRAYDPIAARWISRDPRGLTDSTNQYQYAFQNPISHVDPVGDRIIGGKFEVDLNCVLGASANVFLYFDTKNREFAFGMGPNANAGTGIGAGVKLHVLWSPNPNTTLDDILGFGFDFWGNGEVGLGGGVSGMIPVNFDGKPSGQHSLIGFHGSAGLGFPVDIGAGFGHDQCMQRGSW